MKKVLLCSGCFIILWSCKKESETTTPTDCSSVSATYSGTIKPLVTAKCATAGCHGAGSVNGDYTTYAGLFAKHQSGALKQEVITDKTMPQGSSLSATELKAFECWIEAGAPDN